MPDPSKSTSAIFAIPESVGRGVARGVSELGYAAALMVESLYWIFVGRFRKQPVSIAASFEQMMQIGVSAIPIVFMLSFTIGLMLAIQGIHTLKTFGAESQVVLGLAISVSREFASLITGILVAGRSGSALAARIGTMVVNQEIDALRVLGINPARHLVAPALVGMMLMMPMLTILAGIAGLTGGGLYTMLMLDISPIAFMQTLFEILEPDDVFQGLYKSMLFALITVMVGTSNGFSVAGGAEGVGRATTRSVVLSITYIVVADMAFTFFLTR